MIKHTLEKPSAPKQQRHVCRTENILSTATRLFNRQSFGGVTLEAIATEVGITPGALYHYFEDKEALIFHCHQRSIGVYADELAAADEPGIDGLEVVRRFVRRRLLPGGKRMIAFSDVDALSTPYQHLVKEGRGDNVVALQNILARGMEDGSIAQMDPWLTSMSIFSVLDWVPYWYSPKEYQQGHEPAEAIDDLLTHGVMPRDATEHMKWPDPPDFTLMMDRRKSAGRRTVKREHLLRVATEIFNLKGVIGSSLEEIAKAAGVSRSAYYYHAPDKKELLYQCIKRAFEWELEAWHHVIDTFRQEPDDSVSAAKVEIEFFRSMHILDDTVVGPKSTYQNIGFLNPDQRAEILAINEAVERELCLRYDRLAREGHFRRISSFFMQQVAAGMRNNLPTWRYATSTRSSLSIADNQARLFLFGLKRH